MIKVPKLAAYLVLVVLVVAAVYMVASAEGIGDLLPFSFSKGQPADPLPDPGDLPEGEGEGEETAGPSPVDWLEDSSQFFVEYRLERERVRSQEIDTLQQLINNPNVSEESKAEAEKKLLWLQELMEMELLVENAIRAQDFEQVILIVQEEGALVIVKAKELSSEEILLIAEIASQSTGLRNSQIKISNRLGK